jgi:hypothetical protein
MRAACANSGPGREEKPLPLTCQTKWFGVGGSVLLVALVVASCGTNALDGAVAGNVPGGGLPSGGCDHPNPGCPCSTPAVTAACGRVESRTGDVVLCAEGTSTCDGTVWGACRVAGGEVTTHAIEGSGLHLSALAAAGGPCGAANPCDPYCNQFVGGGICIGPILCVGGSQNGQSCVVAGDCAGGVCTNYTGVCVAGASDGSPCKVAGDCPGGACTGGTGSCNGGSKSGNLCVVSSQCPGGTCAVVACTGVGLCDGGLCVLSDSGSADAGGDGGGPPPTVPTTSNGDSACAGGGGPGGNQHGGACTLANQFTTCKQDFRCDPVGLTCVWNGGPGYYDSAAGGVDLSVGAGCDSTGTGHLPVCNRGSASVASGSTINIDLLNPAQYTSWNTGTCPVLAGPPSCSLVLTAPLVPGSCVDVTGCTLNGSDYAVVNMEAGAIPEAAGRCANNGAYTKTNGMPGCASCTSCNTQISGKVYDPSGVGGANSNNLPLAGIDVLEPAGASAAFVDGVTCDSCTSVIGPYVTRAVTDATGSFTINNATPGPNVPIVVQSGRWRRRINIPITACTNNVVANGTLRFPRNRTEGDIPLLALTSGTYESLECLFARMGVATTEITSPSAPTPGRIRVYKDNGVNVNPTVAASTLWASQASLDAYSGILLSCGSGSGAIYGVTATTAGYFATNTGKGGRLFADHRPGEPLFASAATAPPSFRGTATWNNPAGGSFLFKSIAAVGTPPQQLFYDWLNNFGAMVDYGAPYVKLVQGDYQVIAPTAGQTTVWLRGRTDNMWTGGNPPTNSDMVSSFSFEMGNVAGTPTVNADCGIPNGHGRVLLNGMHVSSTRAAGCSGGTCGGIFPGTCDLVGALSPEEKAMEYQIFQLTACQPGGSAPPPPPPPLPVVTLTRDYHAACAVGSCAKWGYFGWQSVIAPGTQIDFTAQTAADVAGAPGAFGAAVPAGSATTTTAGWTWDACDVDGHLHNLAPTPPACIGVNPAQKSLDWLRVSMKFTPTATVSPILTNWRQMYDCVPCE